MAATVVRGTQVKDSSIQRDDLDDGIVSGVTGVAVVRKLIQGTGISLSSTGFDAGTGDVTISLPSTIPSGAVTTLYIGSRARFTGLANGLRLEIFDGSTWITQLEWTE